LSSGRSFCPGCRPGTQQISWGETLRFRRDRVATTPSASTGIGHRRCGTARPPRNALRRFTFVRHHDTPMASSRPAGGEVSARRDPPGVHSQGGRRAARVGDSRRGGQGLFQTRPHGNPAAQPAALGPPGQFRAAPLPLQCWIPPVRAPGQDLHLRSQHPYPAHPRRPTGAAPQPGRGTHTPPAAQTAAGAVHRARKIPDAGSGLQAPSGLADAPSLRSGSGPPAPATTVA
jgi:hypothetical protein